MYVLLIRTGYLVFISNHLRIRVRMTESLFFNTNHSKTTQIFESLLSRLGNENAYSYVRIRHRIVRYRLNTPAIRNEQRRDLVERTLLARVRTAVGGRSECARAQPLV